MRALFFDFKAQLSVRFITKKHKFKQHAVAAGVSGALALIVCQVVCQAIHTGAKKKRNIFANKRILSLRKTREL